MDTARYARNGILVIAAVLSGAAWEFVFPLAALAMVAAGAAIALTAVFVVSLPR